MSENLKKITLKAKRLRQTAEIRASQRITVKL